MKAPFLVSELEPEFIRYETRTETWDQIDGDPATWRERGEPTKPVTGPRQYQIPVKDFAEAQGVMFKCPLCAQAKGQLPGVHMVQVTFSNRGVTDEQGCHNTDGKPTRWEAKGSNFSDLDCKPSVQLEGGCNWHGYVDHGTVTIL